MQGEFEKILKMLRRRIWIIVILPILSVLMAGYISIYVMKPVYESDVSIIIINSESNAGVTYDDLLISERLVLDYKEIIKSRAVTAAVIQQLMIEDLSPAKLAENIDVQSKNDTNIIEIKVKDEDPRRAQKIVDKLSEVFQQKIFALYENRNVKLVDSSVIPTEPVSPKVLMIIIIAAVAGLVFAVLLVLFIELLDDTIKTSEDAEERLGLPVMGIIPDIKTK